MYIYDIVAFGLFCLMSMYLLPEVRLAIDVLVTPPDTRPTSDYTSTVQLLAMTPKEMRSERI